MRILFDHSTPRGLMHALPGHAVVTAYEKGWDRLTNGELLKAAEEEGFELFVTTDRRIRYQQNLSERKAAILVLIGDTKWSTVRMHFDRIAAAAGAAQRGTYVEVEIPFR